MKLTLAQLKPLLAELLHRLRHPTRRGIAWAIAALPLLLLLYTLLLIPFTPAISDIRKAKSEQPSLILSADGKELAEFKWGNRDWIRLDDVSPHVVKALISTEDHRFYQHFGLDWRRTGSAALATFSGDRQGGSTITQQLARNLFPEEIGRAPNLTRKLKEAITALKIEAIYTKREILETYLNTVPFLYNAYGIEMAARTYFDKPAGKLDVLESATLIGMLKGTSYYNPVLNPERAVERRNIVLAQMVKHKQLDPARYEILKKKSLHIEFERQTEPPGPAQHFAQQLRKWLIDWADSNDYNIYVDGLVVRTTIDSRLQALANQVVTRQGNQLQNIADAAWNPYSGWKAGSSLVQAMVRESTEYRAALEAGQKPDEALKALQKNADFMRTLREQKTRVQAGFLALDPRSGEVKAWVGSRNYALDPFDHVQQARRQPGSTFKPFVYAAAFAQGAKPTDTFIDEAVEIPLSGGEVWRPSDESPPSGRTMSLRDGLVYSKNTITAQVMQTVGPARVARLARAMGVRQSKLDEVPSLALGTSPVTLKEMVAAYGTIANRGRYLEPILVTRIEDRHGKVLAEFHPATPQQALAPATNYTLLDVMRGVVDRGTGAAIRSRFGIRADLAGKTGTTQDNTDGWFILMHPQLVVGAWVGFNDARITLRSDYWGQGAHSALPIVGDFFQQTLRSKAIDAQERFVEEKDNSVLGKLHDWVENLFGAPAESAPVASPQPAPRPSSSVPAEPASPPLPDVPETPLEPAVIPDAEASPVRHELNPATPAASAPISASAPATAASVPAQNALKPPPANSSGAF